MVQSFRGLVRVRPLQVALFVALTFAASHARAAETIAVISLKPSEQLLSDVDYLLSASGMQGLGQFFMPQVKAYFQNVNGKQPIGVVVTIDQTEIKPLGFLPVTNLDALLSQVEGQLGEPIDAGDGVRELQGPQPMFVKEQSGWAFFAQTKDSLNDLPEDPTKLLDGLDKQYDIGIRAYIKNVPEPYKQMAISQIRQGLENGRAGADDATAGQMADAVDQLRQVIQETDTLTVGWQISPAQQSTHFEMVLKVKPGTKMAKHLDAGRDTKTRYGGFLAKDAAIRANMASVLMPDQVDEAVRSVDQFERSTIAQIDKDGNLDDSTRTAATELVRTFFKIVRSTVKTGNFDSCASVILEPKAFTLIAASHVSSGSEVESAVKQLVAMAENEPEFSFSSVEFNAAEHAGVRFHTLAVPIPEDEYLRKVLGDTLDICVGVAESSAYLALGTDGLDYLKQSIDDSASGPQAIEPFHLEISLLSVLKFAQSVEANPMVDALVQIVASADGKDHIRIRTAVEGDSVLYRFELEAGVLKLLGQAGQMVTMGGGF